MKLSDLTDDDLRLFYDDYCDSMRWGFSGTPIPPEHPRYKGAKITGPASFSAVETEVARRFKGGG
jgi:hypothetical protein